MKSFAKKVYIMRGLPGSGKSSVVKTLLEQEGHHDAVVHSTDDYFIQDGQYRFDPSKLAENHAKNSEAFKASLRNNIPLVICDNTNIEAQHVSAYVEQAARAGYSVEIINVGLFKNTKLQQEYANRNQHGVAIDVIKNMANKSDTVKLR